ncbi:right-handed parallel beta-helix repeat-containing protein [Mycetocola zhadangensis]|uniref:Right-handed parallel beta-helix repeat-containing protein n=1 Tax=Mycetocola zhadangensis TaxID=1164595 RepID=A0A3L7ISJ7_9MICO|nr:right-handed parallel beta-helix repeat-containing protein [Mycetocola zhadangensis]RLQ81204.1 right-handed parallel beta-helix repeat-containing protein [Mycetocola zhadangensis]GGF05666.1 hypothetical protein GCM10011313_31020 [Mycetocola zhadangensis]
MSDIDSAPSGLSRRTILQGGAAVAATAGLVIFGASPVMAANTTYYVAANGNDAANGTSQSTPWRTLAKVSSVTFGAGDQILFRSGDTFPGVLAPRGSGSPSAHIVFGRYGSGPRPILQGAGAVPATIHITTSSNLTIRDLEITNTAATRAYRSGILIATPAAGLSNINLRYLNIHDVTGAPYTGQGDFPAAACGGISVTSAGERVVTNLLVQDVTITNVDDHGIRTTATSQTARGSNYTFRYVDVVNAGGNGLVMANVSGALIEGCTVRNSGGRSTACAGIWPVYSENVVVQNNGVWSQTTLANDGFSYNCDWQNTNAIFQYNYSQDSPKGFFQSFFQSTAIVRYNISQNDWSGFAFYGASGIQVYNNTVYGLGGSTGPVMNSFANQGRTPSNNVLTNNILWNRGSGGFTNLGVSYNRNLFHGNRPASEPTGGNKLVADPRLFSPGSDSSWVASGYRLRSGSPALGSGVTIPGNGGLDYYTAPVSSTALPNIGAYNGVGL